MVALANEKYAQLVIHPAPIVVLNLPIALLACIPKIPDRVMIGVSDLFALMMFWLENVFWLGLFFCYEVCLSPFVYFKNLFTVAWATQGLFMTIWNFVAWLFAGVFYIFFFTKT